MADLEHSSLGLRDLDAIVGAAAIQARPVLVRLPPSRLHDAGRALELGASGIQMSNVSSARQAAAMRRAVSFPPAGELSLSLSHRAAAFGAMPAREYLDRLANEVVVVAQIESLAGVDALPSLLAVEDGPDAWFLGPMDLSCDLGHPGDLAHPAVRAALARAAQTILEAGRPLGVFAVDEHDADRWRTQGATLVVIGSDLVLLAARARAIAAHWRATN